MIASGASRSVANQSGWRPILDNGDALLATAAAQEIAETLAGAQVQDGTLAGGSAGMALYFDYLARVKAVGPWRDLAIKNLTHAISAPLERDHYFSFVSGATGIAWTATHVAAELRETSFHTDVEMSLAGHVATRPWRGVYDHSHGLAGYGIYALERLTEPFAEPLLEAIIDRLAETALPSRDGLWWWTAPQTLSDDTRRRYPRGYVNLGLAHGIPSIIAFLAQAYAVGVSRQKTQFLLEEAVRWLWSIRNPPGSGIAFNPYFPIGASSRPVAKPYVRWCYGDLGVAASLYWAATTVGRYDWAEKALGLAVAAAQLAPDQADVRTVGLCHGAAGNGHIFNRLYQATGDQRFLQVARIWFAWALSHYRPSDGFVEMGKPEPLSGTRQDHRISHTVFGGLSGVGLALLAATGSIEPTWDRILMVSIPPRP